MATMSDDGERNCPLCAEEMDLTDQQLKPCRCGYEICVWCWHHIIEMAEKDDSEARCPACRTAYDKERIVGTAAKCERVVAEVTLERKQKPKARVKASLDARKHLNSVRVIQRNLVYVIGLPTNMADESLLERREYFGQYGRVLKVSISRTSGGSQQASNVNTFNVYITYAKEEEAVRCIQAVHNFVLEGKTLRACFGTTKYCRAWLRNMACNNPDCLYLHDVGCQEDSFTKDEVISAYTRNRVPQAGLASSSAQRRIGSVLPPPADELSSSMAVSNSKIVIKASNVRILHAVDAKDSQAKSSPLEIGGSGKPAGLPAAASWGLRTNLRASSAQGIAKEKSEGLLSSSGPPSGASMSSWHDNVLPSAAGIIEETHSQSQKIHVNGRCKDSSMDISDGHCSSAWSDDDVAPGSSPDKLSAIQSNGGSDSLPEISSPRESSSWYDDVSAPRDTSEEGHADISKAFIGNHSQTVDGSLPHEKSSWDDDIGSIAMLASDEDHAGIRPYNLSSSKAHSCIQMGLKEGDKEGLLTSPYSRSDCPNQAASSTRVAGSCLDSNGNIQNLSSQLSILNMESHGSVSNVLGDFRRSSEGWQQLCSENGVGNLDPREYSGARVLSDSSNNRLVGTTRANEDSRTLGLGLIKRTTHQSNAPKEVENFVEYQRYSGRLHAMPAEKIANLDRGESNIISNILSMDFDPWSDASVSTDSFAKFLGESDEQNGGLKMMGFWKGQSNNESRFSFARQESQQPFPRTSLCEISQVPVNSSLGLQNGFMSTSSRYPGPFNGGQLPILTDKSAATRAKTTAPPGFSSPSRFHAPPPGFSSHEKWDQIYDSSYSDNHVFGGSSLIKDHQIPPSGDKDDVEFFDPAILAVGKGRVQHGIDYSTIDVRYPSDIDPRLQLLMQQSFSHQESRAADTYGSRFLPANSSYVSSRHVHQNHPSASPFGMMPRNSLWESNMEPGMSEALRNKALGLDRFLSESEGTYRPGINRDFGI